MNIFLEIPTKNGYKLQFYRFASGYYCQLVTADGFVKDDSIHCARSTSGTWQSALEFGYKYQNL